MAKIKKNFILLFTVFAMLVTAVNLANVFDANKLVYAQDPITTTSTWDGEYIADLANVFTTGTGQQDDPYIIDTANQFVTLKDLVASDIYADGYNNSAVYYKLNTNIDLNNKEFNGIGESGKSFKANFDGNNCSVSNFKYTEPDTAQMSVNAGLFNSVEGSIKNLTVSGAKFNFGLNASNLTCGVICGRQDNNSTIENVKVDSSTITLAFVGSFEQVAVGGISGYVFNGSQITNASCLNTKVSITLPPELYDMELVNTGLIAGSVQSYSHIKNSYSDNSNSIKIEQSSNDIYDTGNYVGGIVGYLAVSSDIEQCFSSFTNLTLSTNNILTNNIGGLVGYIKESNIKNAYAKNGLFKSAISNNTSTNNIGGLVGYAEVTSNLFSLSNKFLLSQCYSVIDTQDTDVFGSATTSATIGKLNLKNFSQTTIQNTFYVPKNSQTLTDYNVTNGSKYTGENIVTQLNDTNAKSLSNYNGFDDSIWCNDLTEPINEGYPILMGVGNDVVPAEKQSYTITIKSQIIDENGTSEPVDLATKVIEEGATDTYQITLLQNYAVTDVQTQDGKVDAQFDGNDLITLSNATGNDTIIIVFTKDSFTVTLEVAGDVGGTLDFATGYASKVYYDGSTSVVVSTADGYRFDLASCVVLSDASLTATKTAEGFSVDNITSDLTIIVTFIKTYQVTVRPNDSSMGLVSDNSTDFGASLNIVVDSGTSVTLYAQITNENTHLFARWKTAQGAELGTNLTLSVTILSDMEIIAEFETRYYSIDIQITNPSGNLNNIVKINDEVVTNGRTLTDITYNQSINLTFATDANCYVDSISINSTLLTNTQIESGSYAFNLNENTTIIVVFADYININVYAYSNTLADRQSYTNTDQQNFVGFAQNPTTISQTTKVKADGTAVLYAVANEKYIFDGWFDTSNFENATAISTNAQFTLSQTQMQTLGNIYAKFSIDTYEITIKKTLIDETGTNTTVLNTITAEYKGSAEYDVEKPQNYDFVTIESNCGAVYDQTTQKIIISNILSSDVVTITFEKQKFALTLTVGAGGQATIDGKVVTTLNNIYYNTSKQIEVLANDGYRFDKNNGANISGTCTNNITKPTDSVEKYLINLNNITSDVVVDISFIKTYVVTISTNLNDIGKVSFDDADYQNTLTLIVDAGSNLTVYAQVETDSAFVYEFKHWANDTNAEVSTNQQYDITDIQTDLTLTAIFAKIGRSFSIQVVQEVASANNVVTANGTTVNQYDVIGGLDYYTEINLAYAEDSGSYLEKVVILNSATGDWELTKDNFAGNSYQFQLHDNIGAVVYFNAYKFNLNLSATNGSLTFEDDSTTKTITAYDTIDITATANTGYEYKNLSGDTSYFNYSAKDGNDIITLSNFTTAGEKTTTLNITAIFAILQYKVVANYGANGSVLINGVAVANGIENTYDYGTPLTLSFVANNEYYLNSVKLNGTDITSQLVEGQFIVASLQENLTFEADFGIKKYNLRVTNDFADVSIITKANGINTTETYFESGTYIELFASCPLGYYCLGYYDQNQLLTRDTSYNFYIYEDADIFAKIVADIGVEQSANGYVTIDDSTSGTYGYGEKVLVQVAPDLGYQFVSFENNIVLDENNYLTVDKTLTIKAVFESKPVEVVLNCDQNGTINSNINGTYHIGDVLSLSLTNNVGYHFAGYSGTFAGELLNELQTTYTILPQDAENGRVEIFANFAIDNFNVYVTSNYGGSVTPYGESLLDYGALLQINIDIYDKYKIGSVLINDVEQSGLIVDGKINLTVNKDLVISIEFLPICWIDFAKKPQGNGTSDNPFIIKTAEELAFIAKAINSQLENASGQIRYDYSYYKLANDIDLNGKFWTPIGTTESPFNGIFDFNYLKIKNLFIQSNDTNVYSYSGLFDVIGEHGKIINQYKNNLVLIIFIISGTVVLALLILLVVFIEKRNRKPKRVIVLPPSLVNKTTKTDNKTINRPDISKLLKK
ncbi:MAG: beta strand repeat-containing protein [Christensenellales bacterium]